LYRESDEPEIRNNGRDGNVVGSHAQLIVRGRTMYCKDLLLHQSVVRRVAPFPVVSATITSVPDNTMLEGAVEREFG
jgi:hypothetical protein